MCRVCLTLAAGAIAAGAFFTNGAALAQSPDFKIKPELTEQCLEGKKGNARFECIGVAAEECQANNFGGESTVGMGFCFGAEWEWWDGRLNAAYGKLVARETADDKDMADLSYVPKKLPALKQMQRAWIPYRDALCEYEAVQWGGGTGGGPATSACLMGETARQAMILEDRIAEGEGR